MAKKQLEIDPTAKTVDEPKRTKEDMKIVPAGVGLYAYEWGLIEKIAAGYGVTRHNLAVYLLRYGLKAYQAGEIDMQADRKVETKHYLGKP